MIPLSAVLARVESATNIKAGRFEPAVYAEYKAVDDQAETNVGGQIRYFEHINQCSPDTARAWLAQSWGTYQIMGFNLASLGYPRTVWDFWHSQADQDAVLGEFLAKLGILPADQADASWLSDDARADEFASRYNGPSNVANYVAALRAAYSALSAA